MAAEGRHGERPIQPSSSTSAVPARSGEPCNLIDEAHNRRQHTYLKFVPCGRSTYHDLICASASFGANPDLGACGGTEEGGAARSANQP